MNPHRLATQLLVTADDFGAGPGRNAGIIRAWQDGIVTGATLLANGPACAEACELALQTGLPLGVHLNLADGKALSGTIAGLTDATGAFLGKARSRAIMSSGTFDREAVVRELLAQVAKVRSYGLEPTHLDTHQHFLLFPALTGLVVTVARSVGIQRLRLPLPMEPANADPDGQLGAELALYRILAPAVAAALFAARFRTPNGLYGMPLLDRLDTTTLEQLLMQLPPGTWELMTHPGFIDQDDPFSAQPREREIDALTAPHLPQLLANRHIRLLNFAMLG